MKTLPMLVTALLLSPNLAEARFGKRTAPAPAPVEEKEKKDKDERAEAPEKASPPKVAHAATPVRPARARCVEVAYEPPPPPPPPVYHRATTVVVTQPRPARQEAERRLERFELSANGQALAGGGAFTMHLLIDGRTAGFRGEYTGIALLPDDGSPSVDRIHLLDAHLTFPLAASEGGRLRAHLGADVAVAPDITFVGPSIGLSSTVALVGPLGFDAGLELTPFPFTQVDGRAGLGVALGPVELRGGVRATYLNDQGRVDGIAHADLLYGPYVGLGLAF